MATPSWQGASAGYATAAGSITQFTGAHTAQWIYSGTSPQVSQAIGTGVYQSTVSTYFAQQFVTGASQTEISTVALQVSTFGGSPVTATVAPLTVSLYASGFGTPTGSPIASASLLEPYVYSSGFWVSVPLSAAVTASTPYWLITSPAGADSAYYLWQQSNQPSGAATAPDGATWTNAPYGLMYQVYGPATTPGLQIQGIFEDEGARTVSLTWNSGAVTGLTEWTQTQGGGALVSNRTLTYSNGLIVGVN